MYHTSPIFAGVPVAFSQRNMLDTISKAEFKRRYPRMAWDSEGLKRIEYHLMLDISMTVLEAVTFVYVLHRLYTVGYIYSIGCALQVIYRRLDILHRLYIPHILYDIFALKALTSIPPVIS
jgi:hypothetical protein